LDAWLELAEEVLAEQEEHRQRPPAERGDGPDVLEATGVDRA
jgi:hypothetical protein